MSVHASNLTFDIRGGHQGGMEPWECTATVQIDADGFYEQHLAGDAGGDPAVLDAATIATTLAERFDRSSIVSLLDRLDEVRRILRA